MKLSKIFKEFFENEKASGLILIFCTISSILLTNSIFQDKYTAIWHIQLAGQSIEYWINDGLMTIFFLLIGLELKREIYKGELSNIKNALLPIFGALGGMVVPALIYTLFNWGLPTQSGAGIPMATDIAFALGVLSLLGNRVPISLKIFLTALAVIDDLGAILVIAVFYTTSLEITHLLVAAGILGFLFFLNRLRVYNLILYLVGGILMWYFMLHSGVHATITGVLLALAIPFKEGKKSAPSSILEHFLHKPVSFFILPLFVLANTAIVISPNWIESITHTNGIGIIAGLVLGKPLGITTFCLAAVLLGFCALPSDLKWKHILGAGFLGGIGFTMSIFITILAFDDAEIITQSKLAILAASLIAGTIGYTMLKLILETKDSIKNHP